MLECEQLWPNEAESYRCEFGSHAGDALSDLFELALRDVRKLLLIHKLLVGSLSMAVGGSIFSAWVPPHTVRRIEGASPELTCAVTCLELPQAPGFGQIATVEAFPCVNDLVGGPCPFE